MKIDLSEQINKTTGEITKLLEQQNVKENV